MEELSRIVSEEGQRNRPTLRVRDDAASNDTFVLGESDDLLSEVMVGPAAGGVAIWVLRKG